MVKYSNKKVIDVSDWDKLVSDTYKRPYSFQQQEGCKERGTFELTIPSDISEDNDMHDSVPEIINGDQMGVKFSVWLARDPKEWNGKKEDKTFLDLFWDRNFYPDVHTLANDLHTKGLIKAGTYTIDIDW